MKIREFQKIIRETYFEKDSKRGKAETFQWFIEEIGELARALKSGKESEMIHEFSDAIAWLFSLANLYGVDMEEAAARYKDGCPKCHHIPCICDENRKKDLEEFQDPR